LAGSALLIGCSKNHRDAEKAGVAAVPPKPSPFEAYVQINADGSVLVWSSQFDMGQGVYQGLATLLAEELGVPIADVRIEGRAGNPAWYGNPMLGGNLQLTGGSSSMPGSWERYRKAGAAARMMLEQAHAGPLPASLRDYAAAEPDAFKALLARAAALPVPQQPSLKAASAWTHIGKDTTFRADSAAKANGAGIFTSDIQLPGMLIASVLHSPRFGGKLASFDASDCLKIPGVLQALAISTGVAVVAKDTYSAMQGVQALRAEWDNSAAESRSSEQLLAQFEQMLDAPGLPAKADAKAAAAMAESTQQLSFVFRFPYLAHAALEPLNAVVHKAGDVLHVYGGLQMPDVVQGRCAEIAGLKPEQVRLHVMKVGGGFGRRAVPDSDVFVEAMEIAKAMSFSAPIKLQWTRAADMQSGRYRPLTVHRVKLGLKDNALHAWQHHIVSQSILQGSPFEAFLKDGIDSSTTEGVADSHYQLPNFDVQVSHPKLPISVLWWRSVGHTHTAFVMETMLDHIAHTLKLDPVAYRLSLLPKDARERAVLTLAAEQAGWSKPLAAGRFRGIAVHASFGSYVATVAEISLQADNSFKVERCVVAADCGIVINPDIVRAQLEGGTGFGLSAALAEQLTIEGGAAVEANYDAYTVMRMDAMPRIECHWVKSDVSPTGIGECAVPTIAPAVANALFQASGERLTSLPLRLSVRGAS
jgi:isoquinoline 1-oxidoreductase subunit beta